jgi:hypothetical protein
MTAYQAFAALMIEVDQLMLDRKGLRELVYEGRNPNPDEQHEAEAIAELFVDLADLVYHLRSVMPENTAESWFTHFGTLADSSPALREFVLKYHKSYPTEMMDALCPWLRSVAAGKHGAHGPPAAQANSDT